MGFYGKDGGWKCKDSNGSREFYVILRKSEKTRKSFSNFIIYMKESLKIFLTFCGMIERGSGNLTLLDNFYGNEKDSNFDVDVQR